MKIENCPFCDSEGVQIEPYGMVICSNEDCAMRESGAEFPPDMWNERPQCSRFREKLNREKMAMLLCAMMCSPLGTPSPEEHWGPVKDSVREIWRSHAATLIAYLTE